jgi:hypothetical protein
METKLLPCPSELIKLLWKVREYTREASWHPAARNAAKIIEADLMSYIERTAQGVMVTDEMVERACEAYWSEQGGIASWQDHLARPSAFVPLTRRGVRAALTAALNPKPEVSK